MSWNQYIDSVLANCGGHCDRACIVGLDGSLWTTSEHAKALAVTAGEVGALANGFKSKDFSGLQANGVNVAGVKYQFLRDDEGVAVYAKKKDHGQVCLMVSSQAIVIGHAAEGMQAGNLNKGVATVVEYLKGLGY